MHDYKLHSGSEEETIRIGEKLAILLRPGSVVTLSGQLGAGKTTLVKGIAAGLGVKQMVTSPTFTIIKEYEGELPLYHMDAYRLEHSEEDIGFLEYFSGDGISVVEWATFIEDYIPDQHLNIDIQYEDNHKRMLVFKPHGLHYEQAVKGLYRQ